MRRLLSVIAGAALCPAAMALSPGADGTADTLLHAALLHHAPQAVTLDALFANPALRFDAYDASFGQLRAAYDRRHEAQAYVMQNGSGHYAWSGGVDTYRRLGDRNVVWGKAEYAAGRRDSVQWATSGDWTTVYPHVMADTTGGDLDTERYAFTGGVATRLGRWTIGEELDFRADHEWRTHDPRPRNIITALDARLAASYALPSGHRVAVGGSLTFYKQTSHVDFYREVGKQPEYPMTGLGQWIGRFAGLASASYYKATGWAADVALRPDTCGLFLTAQAGRTPYRRILSSLNALPLSKLYVTTWSVSAGWRGRSPWAAWVAINEQRRLGDEVIAGDASASQYDVLGYLSTYRNRLSCYSLNAAYTSPFGLGLVATAGYQDYTSTYAFPHSAMRFGKRFAAADLTCQRLLRRTALTAACGLAYYDNVSAAFEATSYPDITMDVSPEVSTRQQAMIADATRTAQASYRMLTLSVRVDSHPRLLRACGLFGSVTATLGDSSRDHATSHRLSCSAGLTF